MKVIRNVVLAALLLSVFSGCGKELPPVEPSGSSENKLVFVLDTKSGVDFIATPEESVAVGDIITVYRFADTQDGSGVLKDVEERVITASESGDKQLVFEGLEVGVYYNYYFVINIAGNATSSLGVGNLPSNITEKTFRNLKTDLLTSVSAPLTAPLLMSGKTVAPMGDMGRTKVTLNRAVARFDIESHLVNANVERVLISGARSRGYIFKDRDSEQVVSEEYSMEIPIILVVEDGVSVARSAFYLYPTLMNEDTNIAVEVKHKTSGQGTLLHIEKFQDSKVNINSRYSLVIDASVIVL